MKLRLHRFPQPVRKPGVLRYGDESALASAYNQAGNWSIGAGATRPLPRAEKRFFEIIFSLSLTLYDLSQFLLNSTRLVTQHRHNAPLWFGPIE
jgi:hypothetical protein